MHQGNLSCSLFYIKGNPVVLIRMLPHTSWKPRKSRMPFGMALQHQEVGLYPFPWSLDGLPAASGTRECQQSSPEAPSEKLCGFQLACLECLPQCSFLGSAHQNPPTRLGEAQPQAEVMGGFHPQAWPQAEIMGGEPSSHLSLGRRGVNDVSSSCESLQ